MFTAQHEDDGHFKKNEEQNCKVFFEMALMGVKKE